MVDTNAILERSEQIAQQAGLLTQEVRAMQAQLAGHGVIDPFIFGLTVFVLACFVGYYVVWKVTPALHTPLMSVTNAISGIIVVGAIIALGGQGDPLSQLAGFVAVTIASINIFGGFVVTQRMLKMFQKKTTTTTPKGEPS